MFSLNEVIEAVNAPVDDFPPISILLSDTVGVPTVFQHTPCAVGFGTPKEVTFPFPIAVVDVIDDTACVVTVSGNAGVTADDAVEAEPVPTLLVAVTVKVYAIPLVNPVTEIGLVVPVPVKPPGPDVTV